MERERQSVISITRNYTDHDREKKWIEPGRPRHAGQESELGSRFGFGLRSRIYLGRPKN